MLFLQGCYEMEEEGLAHFLPADYIVVIFCYGMSKELLWRVSWAMNVIRHNIVDLSDYNCIMAIGR